jgi:hypothetical protein
MSSQSGPTVQVWDHAETMERSRMLSAIFERILVDTVDGVPIVIAIPRPGWKPFFAQRQAELDRIEAESLAETGTDRERETGVSRASTTPANRIEIIYRLAATA